MKATLLHHDKALLADGSVVEMKIWRLPEPDAERPHGLEYSLFYGRAGKRLVGYDNEKGKGDHRHYGDREEPYPFTTIEQLMADFLADIQYGRGE